MDTISPERRSENMRRVPSKSTQPELRVRRLLHAMGYRYRLHRKSLPGHPDIIFPTAKQAIFVHGCFWHQHVSPTCRGARTPKSRQDYWIPKLERNRLRDAESLARLKELGWKTLVVWECETGAEAPLRARLQRFLGARGPKRRKAGVRLEFRL